MNPEYSKIFDDRGNSYDAAMRRSPDARRLEFENIFSTNKPGPGDVVIDIPAGGGYLQKYLPDDVRYHPLEITAGFGSRDVSLVQWNAAWSVPPGDHVVSVAALHHFDDHEASIGRLLRAAKPGGRVHVADVARNSAVSRFLDDFVGAHNGLGHNGNYLCTEQSEIPFRDNLERAELTGCPWRFTSQNEMIQFTKLLFGLSGVDDDVILDALSSFVGVENGHNEVWLLWSLLYLEFRA